MQGLQKDHIFYLWFWLALSKIADLEATKGVFVSSLGFSKSAKLKAKYFNIDLFSIKDNQDLPEDIKIPVLVEQVHPESVELFFEIKRAKIQQLSSFSVFKRIVVNDANLFDVFNAEWRENSIIYKMTTALQTVRLSTLTTLFLLTGFANGTRN